MPDKYKDVIIENLAAIVKKKWIALNVFCVMSNHSHQQEHTSSTSSIRLDKRLMGRPIWVKYFSFFTIWILKWSIQLQNVFKLMP